jgi:CRP-like cAMP-binding protein
MFVVLEGSLEVWMAVGDATAGECVNRLGPGAAVGEMSLLTGAPRSATLRASTAAVLQEIRREDLAPLLASNPALAERFAEALSDRRLADERRTDKRSSAADARERESSIATLLRRARLWFALSDPPTPRD